MLHIGTSTGNQHSGIHDRFGSWRSSERFSGGHDSIPSQANLWILVFGQCKYWLKIKKSLKNMYDRHTISAGIESATFDYSPTGDTTALLVCCLFFYYSEIMLYIETTDYRSNFAKTILFENCSCFWKKPFSISVESPRIFQCLISIPAGHWVRQIDGDLPRRFFLSAFLSLVISMTGRSERSARAMRDGADVVREAIGN